MDLVNVLTNRVVVLDGGLSTALEQAGHDLSDELWTARLLLSDPDAVRAAHAGYLRAGADVVITSSYQASFEGFARRSLTDEQTVGLMKASVSIARSAASEVDGPRWVAASVGPYGAVLADGSEYRGRYGRTTDELERFHRRRIEVLADAGPDLLAVETIPDAQEAEAVLRVVVGSGVPAWLSYSVRDGKTCAGQSLEEAFGLVKGIDEVVAVGLNCSAPEEVAGAVATARAVTGLPVVVYPNTGEQWNAAARAWSGGVESFAVTEWAEQGARLIGGCCRVGPAGIAEIARALR
ncbi:homocysteine S-methyltransferase [Lentzea sp. NPDC042327]|uniref:homocysteine S-methyltransferase n=1 Tax=Lentzea sp. NPDC042327 TaxID=3154801 RepID=UPI0033C76E67